MEGSLKKEDRSKFRQQFKFENLIIWQRAMELGENINSMINTFPKREVYSLSSQMLRATDSMALNIAESSIGQSKAEFKKFVGYSIRSLAEVVTCLYKAETRRYISSDDFDKYYKFSFNLMNMMVAFKKI